MNCIHLHLPGHDMHLQSDNSRPSGRRFAESVLQNVSCRAPPESTTTTQVNRASEYRSEKAESRNRANHGEIQMVCLKYMSTTPARCGMYPRREKIREAVEVRKDDNKPQRRPRMGNPGQWNNRLILRPGDDERDASEARKSSECPHEHLLIPWRGSAYAWK
jgi:hypothetical protein